MDLSLKGRCAIITGASQGLGEAIALEFVKQGVSVVICARDRKRLAAVKQRLEKIAAPGSIIAAMGADVSREADVRQLVRFAIRKCKRVDILVNNAGVYGPMGPSEKTNTRDWIKAVEINLFGTFYGCKHVLAHMKKNRYGKIINVSGGGATSPLPFISAYAASKAGVVRLTETLARECKGFSIDINALAPGALNTRFLAQALAAGSKQVGKDFYAKVLKQKKEGGVPLELGARLCAFLASGRSDGISGRLISAPWDPWISLTHHRQELMESDIYTLRRIVPADRGKKWG